MLGDKYRIFYSCGGYTFSYGEPVDTWKQAKILRRMLFNFIPEAEASWVMRYNPSLNLRQEKFGHTLRYDEK